MARPTAIQRIRAYWKKYNFSGRKVPEAYKFWLSIQKQEHAEQEALKYARKRKKRSSK